MLVSFSKLPDFVFHRRKKRLKCKRYIWIIESLYKFCTVWITQRLGFFFSCMIRLQRKTVCTCSGELSLLKIVLTCHWFSEYCVQYNSYGLKQARTKMRLFRVGALLWNFHRETFCKSAKTFSLFLVLIPKKNAWTFRCLLLKLGLHAREDNSDMFGFVVLGDGAHWLDRMTFFFFLKKPWLLFLFCQEQSEESGREVDVTSFKEDGGDGAHLVLMQYSEKEKTFHVRRHTALFPGLLLS